MADIDDDFGGVVIFSKFLDMAVSVVTGGKKYVFHGFYFQVAGLVGGHQFQAMRLKASFVLTGRNRCRSQPLLF